jgi:type I restriction enzyme M protein
MSWKGGRIDIIVKHPISGNIFLFIECKAPDKYDTDLKYIDGQLFRLSKQEGTRPANLVCYTLDFLDSSIRERIILVDTSKFSEFEDWDNAGQPIVDSIPADYKKAKKRQYAKVDQETELKGMSCARTASHEVLAQCP